MNPRIVIVEDWPLPDTVTPAIVCRMPSTLLIAYGTGEDQVAVVRFSHGGTVKVGGPNDEALRGHPLHPFGLQPYAIHRVESSPWLDELERLNSIHPRHSAARFRADKVHYVFALKEETIEVMAWEPPGSSVVVDVFESRDLALRYLREQLDG